MLTHVRVQPGELRLDEIDIGERLRKFNPTAAAAIRESVRERGVIQPIVVRQMEGAMKLIAGLHRLEVTRELGRETIKAYLVTCDHIEARLAEIDENLSREVLDDAEEAGLMAARLVYFRKLHKLEEGDDIRAVNAKKGAAARWSKGEKCQTTICGLASDKEDEVSPGFIADTMKETGKSRGKVERASKRSKLNGVKDLAQTPAAKGVILEGLYDVQKAEPETALKLIAHIKAASDEEKEAKAKADEADRKAKEEAEAAEVLRVAKEKAEQDAEALRLQEAEEEAKRKDEEAERLRLEEEEKKKAALKAQEDAKKAKEEEAKKSKKTKAVVQATKEKISEIKEGKPKVSEPAKSGLREFQEQCKILVEAAKNLSPEAFKKVRLGLLQLIGEAKRLENA